MHGLCYSFHLFAYPFTFGIRVRVKEEEIRISMNHIKDSRITMEPIINQYPSPEKMKNIKKNSRLTNGFANTCVDTNFTSSSEEFDLEENGSSRKGKGRNPIDEDYDLVDIAKNQIHHQQMVIERLVSVNIFLLRLFTIVDAKFSILAPP